MIKQPVYNFGLDTGNGAKFMDSDATPVRGIDGMPGHTPGSPFHHRRRRSPSQTVLVSTPDPASVVPVVAVAQAPGMFEDFPNNVPQWAIYAGIGLAVYFLFMKGK